MWPCCFISCNHVHVGRVRPQHPSSFTSENYAGTGEGGYSEFTIQLDAL